MHMRKEVTTLDDGRYLIYYWFDSADEGCACDDAPDADAPASEREDESCRS
jgi:hypothetical protein